MPNLLWFRRNTLDAQQCDEAGESRVGRLGHDCSTLAAHRRGSSKVGVAFPNASHATLISIKMPGCGEMSGRNECCRAFALVGWPVALGGAQSVVDRHQTTRRAVARSASGIGADRIRGPRICLRM